MGRPKKYKGETRPYSVKIPINREKECIKAIKEVMKEFEISNKRL